MSVRYFADLHVHPILYAFNRMRNTRHESDPSAFHPWNVPPSDLSKQEAGARATDYSQGDFAKLTRGNARLICASLTPIEMGFLEGSSNRAEHRPFVIEALKMASGVTAARSAIQLARQGHQNALKELTAIFRNRGPMRRLLQAVFLNYSPKRIRYLLSRDYDYWDELEREYMFLRSKDGVEATLGHDLNGVGELGRYDLVRDAAQLREILDGDDRRLAVVLTIEGGHVFSMKTDHDRQPNDVIFERIEKLKNWNHPILFLTAAHHFDNGFCGHARSLVDIGGLVMDQTPRMHEGFEAEDDLGRRVFRAILDVDEDLHDLGGRRILIDCKHLSPRVRKAYYEEIVRPYLRRTDRERPPIPVIHSHTGYSGVATLDDQIRDEDKQDDHWHLDGFNAWGINVCDEDVRVVHETGGLLGVCFDQRIAGVTPNEQVPAEHYGRVLVRQILGIVDVIMLDDRRAPDEKIGIWDCISIGSDFDGVIHPIAGYATALSLPDFADELRTILHEKRHTRMIERIGVDELVDRICWKNIQRFVERHLPFA